MSKAIFLIILLIPFVALAQTYQKYTLQKDRLSIQLSEGKLDIIPLSDKAINIKWEKDGLKEEREFVFVDKHPVPAFKFSE